VCQVCNFHLCSNCHYLHHISHCFAPERVFFHNLKHPARCGSCSSPEHKFGSRCKRCFAVFCSKCTAEPAVFPLEG
jgi:hypothetical protein